MKKLNIKLADADYNILIKRGIIDNVGEEISKIYSGKKIVLITDENVERLYFDRISASLKNYDLHKIVIVPGEKSKSIEVLTEVYSKLASFKVSRSDLIIAFGGGVVGDLGGFAAATFLRGVPYIQIPTSLLAQIDSSIGGKVAVDLKEGKNLVGSFYHPKAVFIDPELLKTLSTKFLHDGIGEVIKYGAIRDKKLFYKVMNFKNDEEFLENVEAVIYSCCSIKKVVVENDEKDNGERMILNFGHTIGHAVEEFFNYEKYTHGEGVAYGMYAITKNSESLGDTDNGTTEEIKKALEKYKLSYNIEGLRNEKILETVELDKKGRGDYINLILLNNIGSCFIKKIKKAEMNEYLKV
ncbi:3-dehydroquinate synthase [Clostridium hydrogenum]|uniref:3-dehydroquinate synthase n=1 Tax=Clostridium hydrogenum TaxID=2855764 RepID=UPI001F18A0FB|nr:3-dehydroquinate synthase [Clostridium hydrogenum]